jgi:hypothetical protein
MMIPFSFNRFFSSKTPALLCALALGSCAMASLPYVKEETAQRLAAPAWMVKRDISANDFTLRAYERIHARGAYANIYIEGDGETSGSYGPTPKNPVALHLATKDKAENVIYIARPCQYMMVQDNAAPCDEAFWKDARYSADVLDAYNTALDNIVKRYNISGFNFIGYDGGGTIATLLAAQRADAISLRTVAGILDHKTYTDLHTMPALDGSLNPITQSGNLTRVPQFHFIGGQDNIVPPAILQSYLQSAPTSHCVQSMMVQEASHDTGWVDKWPELLALPVTCYSGNAANDFSQYDLSSPLVPETGVDGEPMPSAPKPFLTIPEIPEKP